MQPSPTRSNEDVRIAKRRRTIAAFERQVMWDEDEYEDEEGEEDYEGHKDASTRKRKDSKTAEEEAHQVMFEGKESSLGRMEEEEEEEKKEAGQGHVVEEKKKQKKPRPQAMLKPKKEFLKEQQLKRRQSHDPTMGPRQFLIDVEKTRELILRQEDTDGDKKITIMDNGPKIVTLGTLRSEGFIRADVRGTYVISTLLQELALAHDQGQKRIVLSETILNENPVDRLTRMIRTLFWKNLTRSIDLEGLTAISADPKAAFAKVPRIYIPYGDHDAIRYFREIAERSVGFKFEVVVLPEQITPEFVKSINHKPGILGLQLRKVKGAKPDDPFYKTLEGVPFVVPGGRFNEMYGWDSYFVALGLLIDDHVELAQGMVDNFVYEINHYGMILNANRSYYLTRSQPPFLTDMLLQVFKALPDNDREQIEENKAWLTRSLRAAIKEYFNVWMSKPRFVEETGLSRYYDPGIGMPPETEPSHFDAVLSYFAKKHDMTLEAFRLAYVQERIRDSELDEYFTHDRAVRESGHDTTYRLDGRCSHLNVVELNCLLYKYEIDIANTIKDEFGDELDGENSAVWFQRAAKRAELLTKYCWNEEQGMFFDYNIAHQAQTDYFSVTTLFPLWAGCATEAQTQRIIEECLPKFECAGGLASGLELSRGTISLERPSRQWDYPYGWAPHQMIAWEAMVKCGKPLIAQRLAYKWLFMITRGYVDYNGTVPEKYDVVKRSHFINVEYGNVGVDFAFISKEGFGWMNASFQIGLNFLNSYQKKALKAQVVPEMVFKTV